jgi:hypothetical protein
VLYPQCSKKATGVAGTDRRDRRAHRLNQGFPSSDFGLSQSALDLREGLAMGLRSSFFLGAGCPYSGQGPGFEGVCEFGATPAAKILALEICGPSSKIMDSYPLTLHGVYPCRSSRGERGTLRPHAREAMQDPEYDLPRTRRLPGSWVNRVQGEQCGARGPSETLRRWCGSSCGCSRSCGSSRSCGRFLTGRLLTGRSELRSLLRGRRGLSRRRALALRRR